MPRFLSSWLKNPDRRQADMTIAVAKIIQTPHPKQISNQVSVIASPYPVFLACTAGALIAFPFAIAVQFMRRVLVAGLAIHRHVCDLDFTPPPLLFRSSFPFRL
jgi:hypothetical protein